MIFEFLAIRKIGFGEMAFRKWGFGKMGHSENWNSENWISKNWVSEKWTFGKLDFGKTEFGRLDLGILGGYRNSYKIFDRNFHYQKLKMEFLLAILWNWKNFIKELNQVKK